MELLRWGRGLLLGALLGLGACADDCSEGQTAHGDCAGAVHYERADLSVRLGADGGYDSLRVRLYRGSTVEGGVLLKDTGVARGTGTLRWNLPMGSYAASASYWRGGTEVTAIDGGDLAEASVSHCTCNTYEEKDAALDLVLADWPR